LILGLALISAENPNFEIASKKRIWFTPGDTRSVSPGDPLKHTPTSRILRVFFFSIGRFETLVMDSRRRCLVMHSASDAMSFLRHRPLVPVCLAYMLGLTVGDGLPGHAVAAMSSGGAILVLACVPRVPGACRALMRIVAWGCIGYAAMQPWTDPAFPAAHVIHLAGGPTKTIRGHVAASPRSGTRRIRVLVAAAESRDRAGWVPLTGNVLLTIGGKDLPVVRYGDIVTFTGTLSRIRGFRNPGGFDYRRYMARHGVWVRSWVPTHRVTVSHAADRGDIGAAAARLRERIGAAIDEGVGHLEAGVLKSVTVGDRQNLDADVRQMFRRIGIGHLLAISGLHMGIVAMFAFAVFRRLWVWVPAVLWAGWVDRLAMLVTLPMLFGYAMLAGMSPSTQRALAMAIVFFTGAFIGRRHDPANSLAAAALAILIWNPPSLFSISFQFSFAAVAAILVGLSGHGAAAATDSAQKSQERSFRRTLSRRLAIFLWVTILASFGTYPLAMRYFQEISLIGCAANILFVPLFAFGVIPVALTAVVLLPLHAGMAGGLFSLAGWLVHLGLAMGDALAAVPYAALSTFVPTLPEMAAFYVAGWMVISWVKRLPSAHRPDESATGGLNRGRVWRRRAFVAAVLLFIVGDVFYWANRRFWHTDLRVTCLDVGQGSAALIEYPGGHTMLIDGGGFAAPGAFYIGAGVIAPFLRLQRIFTIDTMVLSHPNSDHMNGLIHIARTFDVGRLWWNGENRASLGYDRFMAAIAGAGAAIATPEELTGAVAIGPVTVRVLHPPMDELNQWRDNDRSLVLKITMKNVAIMFPGDITESAESAMAHRYGDGLAADVLIAPHHGSRTSSSPLFLSRVRPAVVVVSAGQRNRYGFPHLVVLSRYRQMGAQVVRTDDSGAVLLSTDGITLRVRTAAGEGNR